MKPNIGKTILGGLVATVLMTAGMYFIAPIMMGGPMDVAKMLGSMLGDAEPYNTHWLMGMAAHVLNGVVIFPLIYAFLLFRVLPGGPWLKGLIWGLALWLVPQTALPMMMGNEMFGGGDMMKVMGAFGGHAVYGVLLGVIGGEEES